MGIWAYRHFFAHVALILITLFMTVIFMHTFIPHDHQYESSGSSIILPMHSATGEKFFTIMLPVSLFIAFSTILFTRNIFLEMRLRARKEPMEGIFPDIEQLLFARGVLHSKAY